MVKLFTKSPVDSAKYPFLYSWDEEVRKNYEMYQKQIDRMTYHLQRSQRGIGLLGNWLYPNFHQRHFMLLDLYKKKQMVGRVFEEELQEYEAAVNPKIRDDMRKTFDASWPIPYRGFAVGTALQVVPHYFNMPYSFRLAFFLVPGVVQLAWRSWDNKSHFRSIEFLSWVTAVRTAKAQIERARLVPELQTAEAQEVARLAKPLGGINQAYKSLIDIALSQGQGGSSL